MDVYLIKTFFLEKLDWINVLTLRKKLILTPVSNSNEIKEFLSIEELMGKLKTAKVNPLYFTEEEYILAKNFFRFTNYYSFSIYRKQLTPYKNELSPTNYTFTDCLSLYDFDAYLRERLNHFAGIAECVMKATFVTSTCEYYKGDLEKAEFYLDKSLYNSKESYELTMEILNKVAKENKSLIFEHHRNEKGNKFPFWVLIEELTFGEATKVISSFKKEVINNWITTSFIESKEDRIKVYDDNIRSSMFGWFQAAWHIRNVCAHYSRIYGSLFKVANPSISAADKSLLKKNKQNKLITNKQLFAYLLSLKNVFSFHLIEVQTEWNTFIEELRNKVDTGICIELNKLGFIPNWDLYLTIDLSEDKF